MRLMAAMICWWLLATVILVDARGPPADPLYSAQMQSRAVDTRVTLEIREGQPPNVIVGRIPTKPGFTYRFNEPPREFSLDPKSGEIRTNTVLDRESKKNDRYDLVVLSSQPTYPIEVRIVVLDINDNPPEFPEPSITVTFSESAAPGTRLLLDSATDKDTGINGVSDDYRIILGNKDDKFKLAVSANPTRDTSYLHLETTGKLDRETQGFYTLNISARDGGQPPKFGYLQVNVTILDVNDNPPIFDHSDYIVSLNESVPPGTEVLRVMATDNDSGDNAKITYYLADTERQFSVNPETGVISTTEVLQCPQQNCHQAKSCPKSCVFTVSARDHGSPRQDGRTYVTVNLVDANDHDPVIKFLYFPTNAQFATVDENALNVAVVAAIQVEDSDEGLNGETTVRIVSGNELKHFRLDYGDHFDIVRVSGVLDREEISKYNLTVVATDKGTPPRTATAFLIIHVNDVNDHEPVFEKSEYSAILSELAPAGTYVAGITATDEDTGVNAQISYAFVSGNDHKWFAINSDSGLITTSGTLDREIMGSVELNISARDGGPNPKWAYTQLKITVLDENDEAPQFSQAKFNVSLSESAPAGTLIAMLTASDHDQGTNGSVAYSLHPVTRQRYENTFALDSLTGQLTTRKKLDREEIAHYEIHVIARDQGIPPQSSTATVLLNVVDINDNSPDFYPQRYFLVVSEDAKPGSSLLRVSASDRDEGENAMITFKLESGGDGLFSIDEWTGLVSLSGNLKTSSAPVHRLRISCKDHGDRRAADDATVEIIKESDVMRELAFDNYNGYEFKITEDRSSDDKGRDVGTVRAAAKDVTYSIVYGDPNRDFQIDETTGRIRTAKIIDREQTLVYSLSIVARSGLSYGETVATIVVLDLNDNKPVFLRDKDEVRLAENAAVGQEVYLARARDLDAGINSRVTYNLNYNPDDQFRISEGTGVIYLNRPIRAEPGTTLHVEITATDGGEPALSSKHSVEIIVEDVNDHTPIFDHTSYETSLLESTPVNQRFFALSATDADLGPNGRISYQITEGNGEDKFGVFPDGFLYVRQGLDREDKDYYSLSVTASDSGDPSRSSVVPVVIHVIDENDNSPEFTNTTFTFTIRENEPPDSFVGKLTATDRDIGRNAELIFSLSNSHQNDFVVDPKNGFIKTLHVFDREDLVLTTGQNVLTLEATVGDNGSPRLRDKVKVNVHVTDQNDNPPKFLRTPYNVQVSEGATVGTQVIRLLTSDADEGLNGDVYYSFARGNEDGRFAIEEATGQIMLARPLDRETDDRYTLTVVARDAGVPKSLSASTTVSIEVLDENDNSPEFSQTHSRISVIETTPTNTELIQFRASDADLGVNSEVVFSINAGNRKDTFVVDSTTGTLYLHKPLDYEETSAYQLNITASDNGNPRLSTTIMFAIAVEDANDNPPYFPSTAIVRQIKEGIPVHTPIVTVTADDPDSGINGKVTYAIAQQEPEDSNRHFSINSNTGVIHTLLPIDRETIDTFRLTVVATDQAQPQPTQLSADKLVTVIVEDVNDNAPVFVSMNAALLPSKPQQGALIMEVFARDSDSATNGLVTYELVSGNSDLFALDQSTGALRLKKSIPNPDPTYRLSVKATDEAVQSDRKSSEAYLTVIATNGVNQGPSFASDLFTGSVYENEPAGTSILTVFANFDSGGEVEYYVTNVTGDGGQVDRLFDIDTKLGVVSTATQLDREAGVEVYEVEVFAIVAGGSPKTTRTKVQITVLDKNDSPPSFKDTPLHYSISEDLGPGQPVASVKAEDPDTIGKLGYTLLGDDGHFVINKESGVLSLVDSLDRESKDVYRLTVRASDGNQHTDTILTVQITDTNDNPPAFLESTYSFDIPENAARGSRVGQVRATDPDLGVNAHLTYTVISDWANDVFSLNPQTGVFTLTSRLDYEEVQHYILVVQAQDAGHPALSSTLTVYCNVLDLNDNTPIFDPMSYSNEIFENVSVSTAVVTVSATDLDSGENGKISYSITAGDEKGDFEVASNGTVFTRRQLDRERQAVYNLVVTATDQAKAPELRLSSTVQVTIVMKDVNDMSPEFITPNGTSVAENIAVNTVVMAVKAVDKDEGRNGYIEYTLGDDPDGIFSLGPVDGLLRVSGRIDRETRNNYTLTVTARDRGDPPRATQARIFVKILDENDNSPVFDPRQYSASIAENASIGASVLQVSATDIDDGLNGRVRYLISSGDTNRDFSIAEDTGVVRVAKNLNYERKSRYLLTVRAEDCAGDLSGEEVRSDTAEISIAVSDINDNPPTFLDSPYLAYVMENTIPPNGGYVITVKAYDADTPPFNNLVRYFIKEGDTDIFRINSSTGEISLLRALDRETQGEYTLSLVAMDTGSPPLTGTGTVRVIVHDVNDHSPEFKRPSYRAHVTENSPVGSWVLTPVAIDKDSGLNAKIRYSILGDKVDRFRIDQDTGVITSTQPLDREETDIYHFKLMAQDCSTTEPRATTVNLTVIVTDENDNSPTFSGSRYEVYVSDKTKAGQFVFGAKATDEDIGPNSRVRYSLGGEHAGNFTVNTESGVIKATVDLYKLSGKVFNLEIAAEDCGKVPRRASTDLRVFLKPDHLFPGFTSGSTSKTAFALSENVESGKLVASFKATSPKNGPVGSIKYAIAGGNIGEALFIDKNTGEVQVAGKGLDYETTPQYEVWIQARDSDDPPLRSVLKITVNVTDANDNPPIFGNLLYNASILEEQLPPELVVKVSATDLDSGNNGQIRYRLVDSFEERFEIDSTSGEIYTNMRLDREETPAYELIVEALDQGVPQLTGTASVTVTVLDKNDNPPRFTRLFSVNVTENAEIGAFVIRVTSSDLDVGENANATYSFTENPSGKFKIDPITGNVTVTGHLDREQQDEYLLKVAAVDGAWRAETPLTVTIQDQNDNAPEFEHSYYSFNFPELQRNVVSVGQVTAADRDKQGPNSVISYSVQQPSDLFTIDPASGEIFSKRSLRYKYTQLESSPENIYSLTVLATDNGKPPMSSECLVTINIVDANNNAPQFQQDEYLSPVPEDAKEGQKLLKVTATDDQDFGVNSEIVYSVAPSGNGSKYFTIDRSTGWISVSSPVREVNSVYKLRVRATDKGVPPQQDEATVTLVVTGENKFSPVFPALSYQVIVPENEPLGSTILIVNATDGDQGPNGMIRYEISGDQRKEFAVDPKSGAVTILQSLDYDTIQEYRLNITAQDLGFKPRKATAMLTITLTDINDNSPQFNQSIYEAFIAENQPPNSFVYQAKATDIDSPKNGVIQYSIKEGIDREVFTIDPSTGRITAKFSFDYEEKSLYTLDIVASNPDSPMSGTAQVRVHINGVNEFYPRFIQPVFHFDVSESTEVGVKIGKVQATDQDLGDDGRVYYLFVGSSNDRGFTINPESGIISVSRNLDRETQSRIVLTVMAKNSGGIRGNDTDEAQVIITVQDGNDPPEFLQALYEVQISEGATLGTKVTGVKAVDKDVRPQNNQFSYSIIGGNTEQAFKIDPQSGQIETSRLLDRETSPVYSLIVGAIDTGLPPQTGTATVKIHITDINDNGPIFDPPVTGRVLENEPPNTKIMTLSAKDPDLPPNGPPFTYRLVGGKHRDFVKVDKHSGIVVTTKTIDREIIPTLDLIVEVEDSGTPRMKSQHPVKIEVMDQNDSPSSSRSVHVLVFAFNGEFPVGKIADVHPNDPDTTGDYRCKILQPAPGVLSIPSGCNLHSSRVTPSQGYSLSVLGNDGKHSDVISTVTVEFVTFTNETVDNSITIRLGGMTSQQFLAQKYRGLLDVFKTSLPSGEALLLYSTHDSGNGLELSVAIKTESFYRPKGYVLDKLSKRREAMIALFQSDDIEIGHSPCQSDSSCENGGICTEGIRVKRDTRITDSQNIVFTSPLVVHEYNCECGQGFTGKSCNKRQDPCQPNPCKSSGQCRRQGFNFQCLCSPSREGRFCELEKGDACSENPCQNGGSCRQSPDGSSFFCLCRPGYRGNQCEALADSCRPNPCLHGGLCVSLKPGYKCSCTDGRYGRHCEKSTFGFQELSFMTFPSLDAATNDITFIFSTTKLDSLLVYNYGLQTGGRSDFVAVELVRGRAVFSFGGARTAVTSISVGGKNNNFADGNWYKIIATRNGRVVSLSVAACVEHGDVCEECRPGDSSCYADDIGPAGTLNFNNHLLQIGGLSSADPVLERPGQVHSDDLVGCVHSVSINGRLLNLSHPLQSEGITNTCSRRQSCGAPSPSDTCQGFGPCLDRWNTVSCHCGDNLIAPNCHTSLQPITISAGAFVEYPISRKHKRMQLLDSIYEGSTVWKRTRRATDSPAKSVSLLFRTVRSNGVIFYATSNKQYTSLELVSGQLVYISRLASSSVVNMTDSHQSVTDGQWHNVTLHSHSRGLEILLNGARIGDELDSAGVHDFLDPYLTYLSLGGAQQNLYYAHESPEPFEGCLANFTINSEIQPFNGSGTIFPDVVFKGKVSRNCAGLVGVGQVANPDPLSIGITLVIVFFVVLLVAILVSFVVFRLRKQHKEKSGGPSDLHGKQNGTNLINTNGLNSVVNDNVLGRGLHGSDNYCENGDVIRGIGGHPLVGPELLSKKYKERDLGPGDLPRPQRPDIIEREVVSSKMPMREAEHHPPLPPNSNHNHEHLSNDLNSEMPEHYDLENASSIAPSDIDIVYHYKGYREAAGVRKYKATPPPVAGYHHKHSGPQGQSQHRHSPHHPSAYPPRGPPVTSPNSRPHQSTPLARLSPSSEMSAQQPRILTLHDISGKPLQSALLATTSSSGGVGKDVLSNSERSLNSPVMSQLSGQSSSSRKGQAPPPNVSNNNSGMGLTAEEIERLNSRPRTSSLVSTLDAVSSSSEAPRGGGNMNHIMHSPVPETHHSSTTTDESGNDSFTCSEIEYDNASLAGESGNSKFKLNESDSRRNDSASKSNNNIQLPSYDGFDSSYRGSMSTLVASDDELGGPLYRPSTGSSAATGLGWDYLLNWGPNFESLAGVFKDIAELPDSVNGRVAASLRLTNAPKPSEEYV